LSHAGARVRPVEVHASGLALDTLGAQQRRQRAWNAVEQRAWLAALLRFTLLDRLPLRERLARRADGSVGEDVWMPPHHLLDQLREQIGHRELALLLGETRVEDHLEEKIAELLAQRCAAAGLDRFEHFVRFFDQERLQRGARLLAIPRTAAGFAQSLHDVEEPLKEDTGGVGHFRS
jgi:hypothetical protein